MTTEEHFLRWLKRDNKSFCENLQFAIKAWRSPEFTLNSKYNIILKWIADRRVDDVDDYATKEFMEILNLRAQPVLISLDSKRKFANAIVDLAKRSTSPNQVFPEMLYKLLALEWMQDLLRSDNVLTAGIYNRLFLCYEAYLKECNVFSKLQITDFLASVLNLLKEQIKQSSILKKWLISYDESIVNPLTKVLLLLRVKYEINFFDELRELESIIRENVKDLECQLLKLPMHSAMLTLECAIVSRRMDNKFLQNVFSNIFSDIDNSNMPINSFLLRAAYALDILRKHSLLLNFEIASKSAVSFLGSRIYEYAKNHRNDYLREILILLSAALRLNPLILEQHVFEITTWMIVAPKYTNNDDDDDDNGQLTLTLFEEYLVLLLNMFRKLSRAEKFVNNLLKSLKEWLDKNELSCSAAKKVIKRKLKNDESLKKNNKKTKLNNGNSACIQFSNDDEYVDMLFDDFKKQLNSTKQTITTKTTFCYLNHAWPSATVGYLFSTLISGLVIKASLIIWKTLLFALKEQLASLNTDTTNAANENSHFLLDFQSSLLCQYLAGARPTEQYEKYITEIADLRKMTHEVLSTYGAFVLDHPYNNRVVNAFLECCYYFSNFQLLLAYYKPDGLEDMSLTAESITTNIHAFLSQEQWSNLEHQIEQNGKNDCHTLIHRLQLQRLESQKLLSDQSCKSSKFKCSTKNLVQFLNVCSNGAWILTQLNRTQKTKLVKEKMKDISCLMGDNNFLAFVSENAEALELLGYEIFEYLCKEFTVNCKSSLLASLNCDFETLRQPSSSLDHIDFDKTIKATVSVIAKSSLDYEIEKLPTEYVKSVLELLQRLPFGYLRRQTKSLLFAFYVSFYNDLKVASANEEAKQLFDCLTDLLHFGQQIPVFRYFEMTKILQILSINECWEFYKFLFSTIKCEEKGTDEFLNSLEQLLSKSQNTEDGATITNDELRLLIITIETLSSLSGQIARRFQKHLHAFLAIYEKYVCAHFENKTNTKKDKKFVEKTLSGFASYAKAVIVATTSNKRIEEENNKNASNAENKMKENSEKLLTPLNENFRRICKIYIGHSMDYRNPHAIQLTQVALKNRKLLHLDLDEIELVLNTYWRQMNADLKRISETTEENSSVKISAKTSETLVKMIIEHKTNEDFLLTLKDIASNVNDEENILIVIDLLTLIAKCNFSTVKGAIFNEQFKQINGAIILNLSKDEQTTLKNQSTILKLLSCHQACIDNRTIHLTPDTLDKILGFLININIKKFTITDASAADFYKLHAALTSICSSIIKQRHILLMDRIAQFMHIFKDLLQSIVLYKSNRQKDTPLSPEELDELAELALKLEVLMHAIATHKMDVKRVAPFVLIFAINLMVSGKRPTTLYPKMKTHVEAICYSLIGICDHRVGRFILRCSNEASRQAYELLVKDYVKYRKFKGKV